MHLRAFFDSISIVPNIWYLTGSTQYIRGVMNELNELHSSKSRRSIKKGLNVHRPIKTPHHFDT